jgi:hypothetical protein
MRRSLLSWLAGLVLIGNTGAAERPQIGYSYPMGGRCGSSFEAIIGGQHLEAGAGVSVSGAGVMVEVLEHYRLVDDERYQQWKRDVVNVSERLKQLDEEGGKAKEILQARERLARAKAGVAEQERAQERVNQLYHPQQLKQLRNKRQFNPQLADFIRVKVTIDRSAEEGERELRVQTQSGLSNPLRFQVGVLDEVREEEPNDNHHAQRLQQVTLPVLINGQIMPGDMDCFRFEAQKDTVLVVDVYARRLIPYLADAVPGWFQAVVVLYDEEGEELAFTDDYRFNPDPVLFYKVPQNGRYTLLIKDSIYRGREDFVYRIAVGELPFITSLYPLGARAGDEVDITLRGVNLPKRRLMGQLPAHEGSDEVRHITVSNGEHRSNPMPFAVGRYPEQFEIEPNNDAASAQWIELPVTINGKIDESGDEDWFAFEGVAGDLISLEVHARRLHSPVDSVLMLMGPGLEVPLINDDYVDRSAGLMTHHADSYLLARLPSNGVYQIKMADTQWKGGVEHAYRLRVSPARPDFDLRLEPSGMNLAAGGTGAFTVHLLRKDGFEGPVLIEGRLPEGCAMSAAEVSAGADRTRFTITAPEKWVVETVVPEIFGVGEIDGAEVRRKAVPVEDQMQAFLYRHLVPAQELLLTPVDREDLLVFWPVLPKGGVIKLPLNGEVAVPLKGRVRFERDKEWITIQLDAPPKGITLGKSYGYWPKPPREAEKLAQFDPCEVRGRVLLQADESLSVGDRFSLVVIAELNRKGAKLRFTAPAIPVEIVP